MAILAEMDRLVRENATDDQLACCITKLKQCCNKIINIGEAHYNLLISTSVVRQLVKAGFFEAPVGFDEEEDPDGIAAFSKKMLTFVTSLTPSQKEHIQNAVERNYQTLEALKEDRKILNQQTSQLFPANGKPPSESQGVVNQVTALELIRTQLKKEKEQWYAALTDMFSVLSVRQQGSCNMDTYL